jgi:HlyB family type I secretion system ABC transporter
MAVSLADATTDVERPARTDPARPRTPEPAAAARPEPVAETRPEPPPADPLLHALRRLCHLLERPYSEPEIRAAAPVPPAGMDLRSLVRAADRLGFQARVERLRRRRLEHVPTPFLVLGKKPGEAWLARGRTSGHLVLVDPVSGQAKAQLPRQVARMGERLVLLRPLAAETFQGLLREAIGRRLRPVLWEVGLASVVINLLALATPVFLMTVYNKVIGHGALRTLDVLALGMLTLLGFEWLLRCLRGYVASHSGARLDATVGSEVVHHLVHLPHRVFESMPSGQLIERLRQLDLLRQFFTSQMPLLLVDLLFVGLFVLVLFALHPVLGWLTLAAMPLFLLVSALAHRRQKELVKASFKAAAAKASTIGETVGNALTVKALALEPEMERRFETRLADAAWTGFKASNLANMVASSGQMLQGGAALVLVYIGAHMVVAGELSIGALVAATILAARALAPMRQVVGAWHQLQGVRDAFARLDELMCQPVERPSALTSAAMAIRGHIRFEDVVYRYARRAEPALDGLDLDVEPGTVLGIVGPPGSGKSTLAKLVLGLDRPERGRVLLDDVDIRLLAPSSFRQQIGAVPQEVQLFEGTIAENIAMGATDGSFERVVAAAKFVGVHEAIQRLPDGYETRLGERGGGLSAGQRQLLTIARALVRNPRILVLDEATSALDAASEEYLLTNIKRSSRGRTVLLVTHRLAALTVCDRVACLEAGRLAMLGTPGEALAHMQGQARRSKRGLHAV